mgnify:CR=1 FL=1
MSRTRKHKVKTESEIKRHWPKSIISNGCIFLDFPNNCGFYRAELELCKCIAKLLDILKDMKVVQE